MEDRKRNYHAHGKQSVAIRAQNKDYIKPTKTSKHISKNRGVQRGCHVFNKLILMFSLAFAETHV